MPLLCGLDRSLGKRILSESYEDQAKGLRSDYFDITKEMETAENYLTSVAFSDGVLAVGSALEPGFLYFIKDTSSVKDFMHIQRFKLIFNNKKIIASSYTVNSHVKSVKFVSGYISEIVENSKGILAGETPLAPRQFLSLTWNQISVWDTMYETAPISIIEWCDAPLNCTSWSFHDPLIVSGGQDKGLFISDARIGESVWRSKGAHDAALRDAKSNPFTPYWVAFSGENGIVNIWDIRATYHLPVAKIDGHSSTVTSVGWSNVRPENISTSSMDCTMKFWTLTLQDFPFCDTHYKVSRFSSEDVIPISQDRNSVLQPSRLGEGHIQS